MFLAADQLGSQGYPGFANSHGKGGVLRAEGGADEGSRWKRGGRDGWPFSTGERPMLWGREEKRGSGASRGILADGAALCQERVGWRKARERERDGGVTWMDGSWGCCDVSIFVSEVVRSGGRQWQPPGKALVYSPALRP
ncbi:hypothetical protein Q5P01_015912 [Channa striata]|uniref:Uncharacterized protein n=1 Tax=Channa striata TaxID=64152 RepID=A0AA88MD72_CHASR|nr:hypothetical protein Q5P01_015912 [Channa striata]